MIRWEIRRQPRLEGLRIARRCVEPCTGYREQLEDRPDAVDKERRGAEPAMAYVGNRSAVDLGSVQRGVDLLPGRFRRRAYQSTQNEAEILQEILTLEDRLARRCEFVVLRVVAEQEYCLVGKPGGPWLATSDDFVGVHQFHGERAASAYQGAAEPRHGVPPGVGGWAPGIRALRGRPG